ncbi:MAG: hypothetical protein SCARUB_03571 [Candidatus Scalindua rubra]|uniref:Methyltransferase type 11 domain-containing protein n=1 Tax=Candidatus Scalindua rubra TaxID=1872076 RepID=A0A1E3X6Y6_9BACT|nr:MAG: hypothetical protein SCARUB_03571 [Candidatus Scalindua rubra]
MIEVANLCDSSYLYGVYLVNKRLNELSEKLSDAVVKSADIEEEIPFGNNYFDIVFCTETLEHLKNADRCLQEIKRVTTNNGWIVITVPNGTGYWPFFYLDRIIPSQWLRRRLLPYEHPLNADQPIDTCYRYKEIIKLICRNGLLIEKIEGWRYFCYLQMFPLTRDIYKIFYPFVEFFLAKIKMERFAYNLFFLCRKA